MFYFLFAALATAAPLTAKEARKIQAQYYVAVGEGKGMESPAMLKKALDIVRRVSTYGECRFNSAGELTNFVSYSKKHCPFLPEKSLHKLGYRLSEEKWGGKAPDPSNAVSYGCLISWCKEKP